MGSGCSPNKPTAIVLIALLLAAQPAGAYAATPDDPFESMNRGFYGFHRVLDAAIFGPAARAYKAVLPAQLRKGLRNMISNLKEPGIAANDLLQAHPDRTVKTVARFAINSTIGFAGLFDFAHDMGMPHHDNGFGATAGRYNIQPGPYLFIPLVGPTNIRDLLDNSLALEAILILLVVKAIVWRTQRNANSRVACSSTGLVRAGPVTRRVLGELMDDSREFVGLVAVLSGEVDEFLGSRDHGGFFGGTGDGDAPAAAKLEQSLVA